MIKMIVMDMDGTLLNDESKLTPYTIETLIEVQKKGIKLVLSSGRSHITLNDYAKTLKMDEYEGNLICVNGISRYSYKTNTIEYLQKISLEEEKILFDNFKKHNVEIMAVNDDYLYDYNAPEYLKEKIEYKKENNIINDIFTGGPKGIYHDQTKNKYRVINVDNFDNNDPVNKVIIAQRKEVLNKAINDTPEKIKNSFTFNKTTDLWLEISPLNVSKGNNLKALAEKTNISLDEIMVFGDGENDLSMLTIVENSVCMLNGMDSVKRQVKYVSDYTNDEDGVAKFVKKMIL